METADKPAVSRPYQLNVSSNIYSRSFSRLNQDCRLSRSFTSSTLSIQKSFAPVPSLHWQKLDLTHTKWQDEKKMYLKSMETSSNTAFTTSTTLTSPEAAKAAPKQIQSLSWTLQWQCFLAFRKDSWQCYCGRSLLYVLSRRSLPSWVWCHQGCCCQGSDEPNHWKGLVWRKSRLPKLPRWHCQQSACGWATVCCRFQSDKSWQYLDTYIRVSMSF